MLTTLESLQIRELQSLTQDLESSNKSLRVDLAATKEYLQKAKDSNADLRRTIDKLSRIRHIVKLPITRSQFG